VGEVAELEGVLGAEALLRIDDDPVPLAGLHVGERLLEVGTALGPGTGVPVANPAGPIFRRPDFLDRTLARFLSPPWTAPSRPRSKNATRARMKKGVGVALSFTPAPPLLEGFEKKIIRLE
jgi:hypothetical protein